MRIISRKPYSDQISRVPNLQTIPDTILPVELNEKMQLLNPYINQSTDIITRFFDTDGEKPIQVQAVFVNGVIDDNIFNLHILSPLMSSFHAESKDSQAGNLADRVYREMITVGKVTRLQTLDLLVHNIYDGRLVLLFDTSSEFLAIDIQGGPLRALEEPNSEKTLRGSREGFIENVDVNVSLIRRRLHDHRLVVKKTTIGQRTRTPVAILYINDVADPNVVAEVFRRIDSIQTDGILATGYIEQFVEDDPYSLFPQVWNTERPDKMVAALLEGRIGIIANGTPLALVVPALFLHFLQASEDYYEKTFISSYLRILRFLAFFISITLPALYVSLLSFQPELLPIDILVELATARKQVPYPVLVEIVLQELIIQIIIESGIRLPGTVGQTIGIVGGIIMGQAAISANLATPAVIIVIAVTTTSTFAMASNSLALTSRIIRLPLIILASLFGIFGLSIGILVIIAHLTSLESFGVPYFSPFAPTRYADWKDSVYRAFLWKMNQRPVSIPIQEQKRQGNTRPGGKP